MPDPAPVPVADNTAYSDAGRRTTRGGIQNTLASAVVTLFVYFQYEQHDKTLPVAVTAAMIVVVAALFTFAQNIVENKTGRGFLKRVPEEPAAAEDPAAAGGK